MSRLKKLKTLLKKSKPTSKGGNFCDEFRGYEPSFVDLLMSTTTNCSSKSWHASCIGKGKNFERAKLIFDKAICSGAGVVILCAILAHLMVHREK